MAIKLGNQDITLKVGSNDVSAAYLGSTLVYSGGTPPTPSFDGKWLATYTGGTTSSAECDASSAITSGEITLTDLESVVIGDCVTSIGTSAFTNCTSLISITIPNSITNIGNKTFFNCTSLTSVTISSGVTSIGIDVFFSCTSLTSVTIPSSVTAINIQSFTYCSSLTSITIPDSVTSIGRNAFYGCSGLTSITCLSTTPPTLNTGVFNDTNNCPIYVPSASVETYKTTGNWVSLASRIQAIGGGENPNSGSNPNIGGIDDEDLPPDN